MGNSEVVTVTDPHTCGMGVAVGVFEGKWKSFVMWALSERPRRFGETRRLVTGISEKVLTQQLRELQADGIVHREDYDEVPPRVEYSLTERGRNLYELLELLSAWGRDHLAARAGSEAGAGAGAGSEAASDDGRGAPPPGSPGSGS
ncbi:winged helix-turn-helix transcriptional regulator [Streptomyces flavofungini]|uniref:Helix-turn-helix transcriptional regulator n=1 Tax=Streptomyces flavofungini TaxID=68200 RepID=A0ABS0WY59_9ACTN|nr:helix-turn-helix domain-containing protein [Streptomyces flavofungini]MBJ3805741.1 helix-turn-helix transcriptional regulator [Streptomyces flavofungini]